MQVASEAEASEPKENPAARESSSGILPHYGQVGAFWVFLRFRAITCSCAWGMFLGVPPLPGCFLFFCMRNQETAGVFPFQSLFLFLCVRNQRYFPVSELLLVLVIGNVSGCFSASELFLVLLHEE